MKYIFCNDQLLVKIYF